jgi:predicted transposase YbfD/YdcC
LAGTVEFNKGELEVRVLRSRGASPEAIDFPCVEQVARLRRHLRGHKPETVALVTSLPNNRSAWGIENGLHLRLDVSHLDDQCRVRQPKSMRVMGMVRRFSNSLFMHWRSRQNKPQHKTTTDFFTALNAEHHRYAIRCLHARQPSFQTTS